MDHLKHDCPPAGATPVEGFPGVYFVLNLFADETMRPWRHSGDHANVFTFRAPIEGDYAAFELQDGRRLVRFIVKIEADRIVVGQYRDTTGRDYYGPDGLLLSVIDRADIVAAWPVCGNYHVYVPPIVLQWPDWPHSPAVTGPHRPYYAAAEEGAVQ
jgi:hypothetical protein